MIMNNVENNMGLSSERLYEIINLVDGYPSVKEKKAFSLELGINTAKAQEIKNACYLKLRELRKLKNSFEEQDVTDFSRTFKDGIPSTFKHFEIGIKEESYEFAKFFKESWFNKRIKNTSCEKYVNCSGRIYGMSYSDNWKLSVYRNIVKYLTDNNPDTKSERDDKASIEKMLVAKFNVLLKDFKVYYLNLVKEHGEFTYDTKVESFPKLKNLLVEAEEAYDSLRYNYEVSKEEKNQKYNRYKEVRDSYNKCRAFLTRFPTKEKYIEYCLEEGENDFNNNINVLTERVMRKELNYDKITVTNVETDPKIFKMNISDGNITLFARSIFCAVGSIYKSPHFRFIIS